MTATTVVWARVKGHPWWPATLDLDAQRSLPPPRVAVVFLEMGGHADTVYKSAYGWDVGPDFLFTKPNDGTTVLNYVATWSDVIGEAAVELVSTFTNATEACRALVREAVVCWQEEEGDVYRDDITAIVVFM